MSRSSKIFLLFLVVAVGVIIGGLLKLTGPGNSVAEGETVSVTIPEGAGAADVAEILAEEGVISSPLAFRVSARLDDRSNRLQPGTYDLVAGMSAREILEVLSATSAPAPSFRVTIPEGLTVEQTLQRIAGAEGSPFTIEQLTAALPRVAIPEWVPVADIPGEKPYGPLTDYEGLLFPDSYEFLLSADAQSVLSRLVEQTESVLADVTPPAGMDRYDVLRLASLIERETRVAEERPLVSSVLHNRLSAPMRLQVDATVIYSLGEIRDRVLTTDVQNDSPWNTYTSDGLPPTPISGAGRASIEAAANPAQTDSTFYVVCDTETGRHAFASSLAEHNSNVAQFRHIQESGGSFCAS